jgi:hypothetical protein
MTTVRSRVVDGHGEPRLDKDLGKVARNPVFPKIFHDILEGVSSKIVDIEGGSQILPVFWLFPHLFKIRGTPSGPTHIIVLILELRFVRQGACYSN